MSRKEDEYRALLAEDRHLFAWCLLTYGGAGREAAAGAAERVYPYEKDDLSRSIAHCEHAWHEAMLWLHGDGYWVDRRDLEKPPEAYVAEVRRIGGHWSG